MPCLEKIEVALRDFNAKTSTNTEAEVLHFFENDIIAFLQRAVLCGEQYNTTKVSQVESLLDNFEICCSGSEPYTWKGNYLPAIISALKTAKEKYLMSFLDLAKHVVDNNNLYIAGRPRTVLVLANFRRVFMEDDFGKPDQDVEVMAKSDALKVYRMNIFLAYIDENLHCSDHISEELNLAKSALKYLQGRAAMPEILPVLQDKIDFLEFKIQYRYDHPKGLAFDKDAEEYPQLKKDNVYYCLYERTRMHYAPIDKNRLKELNQQEIVQDTKQEPGFHLEPFHHLKRYYRKKADKLTEAEKEIGSLLKKVKDAAPAFGPADPFNKTARQTLENLFENLSITTELKIEIKKKYSTILEDIRAYLYPTSYEIARNFALRIRKKEQQPMAFLEAIKKRSDAISKSGLQDFYSKIPLLDFLSDMISYFKSNPEKVIDVDKSEPVKMSIEDKRQRILEMVAYVGQLCDTLLLELNNEFRVLSTHKVMPVYLTIKECYTKAIPAGIDAPLFLRSSYILPQDLQKLESAIRSREILIQAQKNALKDALEIALNQAEMKLGFEEFEKKVKENEVKVVQIVGIFVTIATFVLLNVKIFDGKSGIESFGIILGLMTCFFIFNLFIYILVLPQPKPGKAFRNAIIKFCCFLLIPGILGGISYFILAKERFKSIEQIRSFEGKMRSDSVDISENYKLTMEHKIDSVMKKLKTDSLNTRRYTDDKLRNIEKLRNDTTQ